MTTKCCRWHTAYLTHHSYQSTGRLFPEAVPQWSDQCKRWVEQFQLMSSCSAGHDKKIQTILGRYLNSIKVSQHVGSWARCVCQITAELLWRAVCVCVGVCEMGYESLSMLIWAKILRAGPSLMFMVPMRWSSFSSSRACPSISWERNSSAISRQPATTHDRESTYTTALHGLVMTGYGWGNTHLAGRR